MGYMLAYGVCWSCGQPFAFNPDLVPSVPVLPDGRIGPGGERQPICRTCATRANENRREAGLPLWNVSDAAYEPTESL
jgi:hypothetical protein